METISRETNWDAGWNQSNLRSVCVLCFTVTERRSADLKSSCISYITVQCRYIWYSTRYGDTQNLCPWSKSTFSVLQAVFYLTKIRISPQHCVNGTEVHRSAYVTQSSPAMTTSNLCTWHTLNIQTSCVGQTLISVHNFSLPGVILRTLLLYVKYAKIIRPSNAK